MLKRFKNVKTHLNIRIFSVTGMFRFGVEIIRASQQEVTHRICDLLQDVAFWTGVTHKNLDRSADATAVELKHKHTPDRPHVWTELHM